MLRFVTATTNKDLNSLYGIHSHRGNYSIHHKLRTDFKYDDLTFARHMNVQQQYTLVGDPDVYMVEGDSSLEGISKKYLSLDGGLATDNILGELRTTSGIPVQAVANHAYNIVAWRWYDNHVSLLINMLRAYHMKVLDEQGELTKGVYPVYNDGHVEINLNQGGSVEDTRSPMRWPGLPDPDAYPEWANFTESLPTIDVSYLDLRPLTQQEMEFVLAMTGPWQRQTNLAIDFSLPALGDRMAYRHPSPATMLNEWLDGVRNDENYKLPSSSVMWSALRKYVNHNRLYNQFYTATQILGQIMVKVVPNSAEGNAWLVHRPQVVLPRFGSIRGRYPFLVTGEAALVQAVALEDWSALIAKPQLLFTYATVVATATNIGLHARRMFKYAFSQRLDDSFDDGLFLTPETFMAAAISLGTGIEAPLNGMANTYVFYPDLVDIDTVTRVPVKVFEGEGYNIDGSDLIVYGIPMTCSPYLIYPLAITERAGPFSGNFVVPTAKRYTRRGAMYDIWDAWKLAWAARIAGYDIHVSLPFEETGLSKYYADNRDTWTHTPHGYYDPEVETAVLTGMVRRRHHFIELPNMLSKAFAQAFEVTVRIHDAWLQAGPIIQDRGSQLNRDYVKPLHSGIQVVSAGETRKFWGTVRRSEQGLAVAGFTMPAVIPDGGRSAGVMAPLETEEELPLTEE